MDSSDYEASTTAPVIIVTSPALCELENTPLSTWGSLSRNMRRKLVCIILFIFKIQAWFSIVPSLFRATLAKKSNQISRIN